MGGCERWRSGGGEEGEGEVEGVWEDEEREEREEDVRTTFVSFPALSSICS